MKITTNWLKEYLDTKLNENEEMRQVLIAKGKVELQKRSWEKTVDIILNNLSNH